MHGGDYLIWKSSDVELDGINTREFKVRPRVRIDVPTPEEDIRYIDIRGRDGELTKRYGYKNISLSIEFYIYEELNFKDVFRKAKQKFINATTLRLVDDDVYYKIKSISFDNAVNPINKIGEFTIQFTLDPFQYEIENNPIILTSSKTIQNDGYKCLPIITATVAGTGNIYIGDQQITVKDVNGTITIDSEMKNAYRKGSPPQNMNKHMIGKFPVFENGDNAVSFDGDISKLEIVMNRRWV